MPVQPGQVDRSCDPRGGPLVRIVTVWDASVDVVDAQDGKGPRRILRQYIHDSPFTKADKPRRTGYALEQP
jgi:hypothetical protein